MRCPPGSVTRGSARHNIRHCICDKGYEVTEGSVATWDCEKCRKSHYCPSVGMGAEVKDKCAEKLVLHLQELRRSLAEVGSHRRGWM